MASQHFSNMERNSREIFFTPTYFDEEVKLNQKTLYNYRREIKSEPINRVAISYQIFKTEFELFISRYSGGEHISYLDKNYEIVLQAFYDYRSEGGEPFNLNDLDDYCFTIWLLSLAILFEVSSSRFARLCEDLDNDGKDVFVDYLKASYLQTDKKIPSVVLHPNPYQHLLRAIASFNSAEQTAHIDSFLKSYYSSHFETCWHDSHLQDDAGFFGYWSFELAAVVKNLQIDDTIFANNMFYPRDLLRKKLFRTWEDSPQGEADRKEYSRLVSS